MHGGLDEHPAVGERPLANSEGQFRHHQRIGKLDLRIEDVVSVLVADQQHVGEAVGHQKCDRAALAFDQRIGHHRGGMNDEAVDIGGGQAGFGENLTDATHEALDQIMRGRQGLVDDHAAIGRPQHDVRECAADID